ncbi:unnamed protein product [Cunninghamella blakesleeana]
MNSLYFGLDPLFWVHVKVFIADILKLEEIEDYKNVYKFEGHLIRNINICGIIVGVEQTYNVITYTIDDSTGTIPCRLYQNSVTRKNTLPLGTCIQLTGFITKFRDNRQINIHDINLITDSNKEILHYLQVIYLKKNHYNEPFQLPQTILENEEIIKNEINKKNEIDTNMITLSQDSNHLNRNEFKRYILQYIKDTYGQEPFEIKYLQENESLNQITKQILEREIQEDHQITKNQINQFITEIINQLDKDGDLINIGNSNSLYQTDNDSQLIKTIENVIRETIELNTSNEYSSFDLSGVQKSFIQLKTREILPLHPISKIDKCLNKMVEDSIIYLTGPYEYRLLE